MIVSKQAVEAMKLRIFQANLWRELDGENKKKLFLKPFDFWIFEKLQVKSWSKSDGNILKIV